MSYDADCYCADLEPGERCVFCEMQSDEALRHLGLCSGEGGEQVSDDNMDTADVLDAAADYIRTFGGTRYMRGRDGGPRCASGAILSALGNEESFLRDDVRPFWEDALQEAHAYVARTFDNFSSIVEFNDAASPDEVIDALQSCAADLRLRTTGATP